MKPIVAIIPALMLFSLLGTSEIQAQKGRPNVDMPKAPGNEGIKKKRNKVDGRLQSKLAKSKDKGQKFKVNIAFATYTVDGAV